LIELNYKLVVARIDLSTTLDPWLQRLTIHDEAGVQSDTLEFELDDREAAIVMPPIRAPIAATLVDRQGYARQFDGFIDEIASRGDRGGGRVLIFRAKGVDTVSRLKERVDAHYDDATLAEALTAAGRAAGVAKVVVDPAFAGVARPYFAQQNESFLAFGQRLAREAGATFRVQGDVAFLVKRGTGLSVGGRALPTVVAAWGDNLVSWDISPQLGRPRHRRTRVRLHDPRTGRQKERLVELVDTAADATHTGAFLAADEADADLQASADAGEVGRARGGGSVEILGDMRALPEGVLRLSGARPGIDGDYRIKSVDHTRDRSGGLTTRLELGEPHGTAGTDSRGGGRIIAP
jgi:phage protein D